MPIKGLCHPVNALMIGVNICFGQVSGRLIDIESQPLPFANVLLLRANDSLFVSGTTSDDNGMFIFENVKKGTYIVKASMLSFRDWYSPSFQIDIQEEMKDFKDITLKEDVSILEGVELTAARRLTQQTVEGVVVNVQSSVLTKGSNALQLLQRSPGVLLDQRNNDFSLNGKSGVNVMINGKLLRIPPSEIMNLLTGISGDNIDRIELLTNPSSKYDADGSAGIINIVLSKNKSLGTNGSFTNTTGIGYGPKQTNSINISGNNSKSTVYGSLSYTYDETIRAFEADGNSNIPVLGGGTDISFSSEIENINRNLNFNTGFSTDLWKASEFGAELQYNFSRPDMRRTNVGAYSFSNGDFLGANIDVNGGNEWDNLITSLYFGSSIDSSLNYNVNVDYIGYDSESPTIVSSQFSDESDQEVFPEDDFYNPGSRGKSNTKIDIGVVNLDFTRAFDSGDMDFGAKYTVSTTVNKGQLEFLQDGNFVLDERFDANSTIDERIGAIYVSKGLSVDSTLSIGAGIRYEYWQREFNNGELNNSTNRLFPSVFLEKKISTNSSINLSYNRRITRPTFNDLAAFLIYNDPTSVFAGNPFLRASLIDNIAIKYNHRRFYFFLGYSYEKNPIARFQVTENELSDLVIISSQNLDFQRDLYFQPSVFFVFQIGVRPILI